MKRMTVLLVVVFMSGCPSSELLRETPVMDTDLVAVEKAHAQEIQTHLLPEGLLIYAKRPPGDLKALYEQGTAQADGAFHNGLYLAALSLKYAVTKDSTDQAKALACWKAHHLLVAGSGYSGLVARSYGKHDPSETTLTFRRDGSGDGQGGWLFGTNIFVRLAADDASRAEAAADVKAIAMHMRKHHLKVYQDENTPTPYGDFNTPVMGVPIGHYGVAMMALANLALKLNPGDGECEAFLNWLVEKDYHRQAQHFYPWFPHSAANTFMYGMNMVTLWMNDESPHRREFYLAGADAFWERSHAWQMTFHALSYKFVGGTHYSGDIDGSVVRLKNLTQRYNPYADQHQNTKTHTKVVPLECRPVTSTAWSSDAYEELLKAEGGDPSLDYSRQDFLLAYWMGRYMGALE
jgi:hypothetical protein